MYLDSQVVLPIVGEGLVEFSVLFGGNVVRVAGPQGLGFVQLLLLCVLLLHSLFLLLLVSLVILIFLIHILDLGLFLILYEKKWEVCGKTQ